MIGWGDSVVPLWVPVSITPQNPTLVDQRALTADLFNQQDTSGLLDWAAVYSSPTRGTGIITRREGRRQVHWADRVRGVSRRWDRLSAGSAIICATRSTFAIRRVGTRGSSGAAWKHEQ